MNKADLIEAISLSANLPKTTAGRALEAITSSITAALEKGDDVTLVGFGTFTIKKRTEREGRNPRTGAALRIAAAKLPAFRAGKLLKNAVN
ncbi:HU family DNA-binding protein [Pseudomonas lopnurensis]|uniref:HU family DNA-binding protein n=1 Tax=Pseudomonas lopnurensis TaxID=1477517 RepID=UPI0028A790FF|nr:HU family DNA-binding protein [Pseudomonas lopnurensis]